MLPIFGIVLAMEAEAKNPTREAALRKLRADMKRDGVYDKIDMIFDFTPKPPHHSVNIKAEMDALPE